MNPTQHLPQPQIAALALQIAQGQVGQAERPRGSNSGPMVDQYLRATGLKPGYPWCQAFVYWCYQQAATTLGISNPVVQTAGVQVCWNLSHARRKLHLHSAIRHPQLVRPGSQFIMLFAGGLGHTGIVEAVEGQVLHTIEGNSNNTGSREGFAVVRQQRPLSQKALKGFLIY
jgi:hypothetical protein